MMLLVGNLEEKPEFSDGNLYTMLSKRRDEGGERERE
jgi:hypothetical protein